MSWGTTGIKRLPFFTAYSSSMMQFLDEIQSVLTMARKASASSTPFSISFSQSTVGGMPSQSTQKSKSRFCNSSVSRLQKSIFLREYETKIRAIVLSCAHHADWMAGDPLDQECFHFTTNLLQGVRQISASMLLLVAPCTFGNIRYRDSRGTFCEFIVKEI